MTGRPPPPSTRRDRLVFLVILGSLSAFGPVATDLYLPALPELGRDLGVSTAAAQLTLTACFLGFGLGQLLAGPLSDQMGRRRPLIFAVGAFAVASLLCVVAPSIGALLVLRVIQGAAGGAAIVMSRAIVRDLYTGAAAARVYSLMVMVFGVAPVLAPIVGAQLLHFTTWRGIFVPLAAFALVLLAAVFVALPESLPPARRRSGGLRDTAAATRMLSRDSAFVGMLVAFSLAMGALLAYIAGSPFVLQDIYGLSPQAFSLVFGLNAIGMVAAGQTSHRLLRRVSAAVLLRRGVTLMVAGGVLLLGGLLIGGLGVAAVIVPLFMVVSSIGLIMPNATALALANHGDLAGTASAVMGACQCVVGMVAITAVGLWGSSTALPMAAVIVVCSAGSLVAVLLATRAAPVAAIVPSARLDSEVGRPV